MDSVLFDKVNDLKNALLSSKEYKELVEKEQAMEEDEEAQKLVYKKDLLVMKYEDNLNIYKDKNNPVLLENKKEIGEILEKINSLEVVKEYNEAYKNYQNIVNYINREIFDLTKDK